MTPKLCQQNQEVASTRKASGEFSRNVLTLMSGTTLAQIVPLLILPVLSRIYSPEQFGAYALFIAAVTLISVVATARYELAVMLPAKEQEALNVLALAVMLVSTVIFALVIIFFLGHHFVDLNPQLGLQTPWLFMLIISVWLTAFYQSISYWLNRKKRYSTLAKAAVMQQLSAAAVRITLGYFANAQIANGLILGTLVGQFFGMALLLLGCWRELWELRTEIRSAVIFDVAKRYQQFPIYNTPYSILGTFSRDYLIYGLTYFGNQYAAGLFSLARSIISAPVTFLSASLGQVFFQKAATTYGTPELEHVTKRLMGTLAQIFLPGFVYGAVWAPAAFALIFGEEWRESGLYGAIYLPTVFLFLFSSWPERIYEVAGKQQFSLLVQVVSDTLTLAVIGGMLFTGQDTIHVVIAYSAVSSVYHAIYVLTLYRVVRFEVRFFNDLLLHSVLKGILWGGLFLGLQAVLSPVAAFLSGGLILAVYYVRFGMGLFRIFSRSSLSTA